jgi:hypothetical protein
MLFVGSQVALIVLGSLPLNMWKSFQSSGNIPPEPPKSGGDESSPASASA